MTGVISEASHDGRSAGPGDGLSMVNQTHEFLRKEFPMVGGDGKDSYSRNSKVQGSFVEQVSQLVLTEALKQVTLPSKGDSIIVADLGSSSGPNAVNVVAVIVEKLRHGLPRDTEFQAYFNDLPTNDFNTLFHHIGNDPRAKNFFAAGVPGSFFGRLFPRSSVHVFYSSACLHWLSENTSADARGPRIKQTPTSRSLPATFKQQASLDLTNFLLARSAEMVSGGLLFMVFGGRSVPEPNFPMDNIVDVFSAELDEVWSELIAEGLVSEQKRDSFNIPIYHRTIEDLNEALASCASLFTVLTAKLHRHEISAVELLATSDASELSQKVTSMHKSVLNNVFQTHLGNELTEVMWERYEELLKKKVTRSPQDLRIGNSVWVVSLISK